MKSNVSGRVVPPQPGSSGCRTQHVYYNNLGILNHSQQHQHLSQLAQQHHPSIAYRPQHHPQQPQNQNYAMLQCFSQHATNGWAGIPLISTAASTNRRQRKQTTYTHCRTPTSAISCNYVHANECELNPMTRLAMHAQGAPLLLTGSYNRNRMNPGNNRHFRPSNSNPSDGGYPCNYKTNGPFSMHPKAKENNNGGAVGGMNLQGDATATCLPRIIKPRKRRKKDRKPLATATTGFVKVDIEPEATTVTPTCDQPTNPLVKQHHHQHQHQPQQQQQLPQMFGSSFEFETQCNLKRNEPYVDDQDTATGSVCFCRQCDPLSRIWAFSLRRSHPDNSLEPINFDRSPKDVGVIGSNRSNQLNLIRNTHSEHLSDSSDSGYGDILSGINIGDDLLSSNYLQLQELPTDILLSPTAESLLTESINEISRKLMETCDTKGNGTVSSISSSSSSPSSDSCSIFSDSGISSAAGSNHPNSDELIFNFKNLSLTAGDQSNFLFPINNDGSLFDCFAADINNNDVRTTAGDKDESSKIDSQLFNCLDMLWGTHPPLKHLHPHPHPNPPLPGQSSTPVHSSSSSSSSSFYRPAVASM